LIPNAAVVYCDGVVNDVYDLYQRGNALLDSGDFQAAIVPLSRARDLEPDKASIREALGRALFQSQRYREAAAEFDAVANAAPTNDYALFCLGRALQQLGRHDEACRPLAIAACLRPERPEYRAYRDRSRRAAARN
jgi:tetratricopeptide (TPR) repeat protein